MRRIVASAGIGLAVLAGVTAGAAAKPGPAQVRVRAGTIVRDNSALKPGLLAQPALGAVFGKQPPAVPPALNGYTVVTSGVLDSPDGRQAEGIVFCPTGTVAFDGGVLGGSLAPGQSINGSVPVVEGSVATGWQAFIDNTTGSDSTFQVYAVCAKQPKQYAIVGQIFVNAADAQNTELVPCPLGSNGKPMKVLGGGGVGGAGTPGQDINTSMPIGGQTLSWRIDINNTFGFDNLASVYAVCGAAKSWKVVSGAAVDNPAGAQTQADAACPSGLTAVSGGGYSSSRGMLVNLNTTYPATGSDWQVAENNASIADATLTPWVVCVL
jgi:hypothetical protein